MDGYATFDDVSARIGGVQTVSAEMVDEWLESCSRALDAEIAASGLDVGQVIGANQDIARDCVVTMVTNSLDVNVGGDWSDSMTVSTYWDKSPKVPDEYRRLLGISRMRCMAVPCV